MESDLDRPSACPARRTRGKECHCRLWGPGTAVDTRLLKSIGAEYTGEYSKCINIFGTVFSEAPLSFLLFSKCQGHFARETLSQLSKFLYWGTQTLTPCRSRGFGWDSYAPGIQYFLVYDRGRGS